MQKTYYLLDNVNTTICPQSLRQLIVLKKIFRNSLFKIVFDGNSYSIYIKRGFEFFFLYYFSNHTMLKFNTLLDLSCVDNLNVQDRFVLYYQLSSVLYSSRITIFCAFSEISLPISAVRIFPNANWAEREVWDLFGLSFKDHPDLRRILTDYGFKGHPLRKDFPLSGFLELFYDESKTTLFYTPIALSQEYRDFKFSNPWQKKII